MRGEEKGGFSQECCREVYEFLEHVIEAALARVSAVSGGVARDCCEELIDLLVDAKLDVEEIDAMFSDGRENGPAQGQKAGPRK